MKQSEMKAFIEAQKKAIPPPRIFYVIQCKHKEFSTSGCTSCWHCKKCGRSGCDNFYYARLGIDQIKHIECDLEEG